jgi:transposase
MMSSSLIAAAKSLPILKSSTTAAGWQRWNQQVAALGAGAVAVCVETSQGLIIEQLLESGVNVYPIAPVSSKAYRERKASSGTKTDRLDAWSLADALRLDGQGWKVLAKEDPLVAELRLLCRDEVALIEERTALVNQLQSSLEQYYPAALEAFEDWTLPAAWGVCRSLSHPDGAARCRPTEMGKVPPRAQIGAPANLWQTPGDLRPGE